MSDTKERKSDLETPEWVTLPRNELRSADSRKTSGNPEEKEVLQDSKSAHQAKNLRILKVVLKRSDESTRMKSCECKQCGKSFEDKSGYVKHLKIHKRKRPSKCMACGKNFTKKSSFVIHQQTHAEGKPFTCNECGKMFGQRSSLLLHSKTHVQEQANGQRNIGCASKSVKRRMGEKPYKCLDCKKMFVLHKNFIKHQKTHVKDVPDSPEPACPSVEEKSDAEAQLVAPLGLMLEELRKMRENIDVLLLNQQSQLQVLQEIQKQLSIILTGNVLINSNVYSLGLLLGQQAVAMGLSPFPLLLSPSNLLPENARPVSSQVSSQSPRSETVLSCLRLGSQIPAPPNNGA